MRLVSFEGGIGSGKTSLANYFSTELKLPKILEAYDQNPFLKGFYAGEDVKLETEITFLLLHYSQLKRAINIHKDSLVLADYSIEKDLVFAKLNLTKAQFEVFKHVYDYVIQQVSLPDVVIYLDLPLKALKARVMNRGRSYEVDIKPSYLGRYVNRVKRYFQQESSSDVHTVDVGDLDFVSGNHVLSQIGAIITIAIDQLPSG